MDGRSGKLHPESMKQLEHRIVARLGTWRKRLVQTLAPKTGIFGKLCHATGACHITHGSEKYIGIGVFQRGGNVFRDGFLIIEVVGSIEGGKFSHGFTPYPKPASSQWRA